MLHIKVLIFQFLLMELSDSRLLALIVNLQMVNMKIILQRYMITGMAKEHLIAIHF